MNPSHSKAPLFAAVASVSFSLIAASSSYADFTVEEKSISQLIDAYRNGETTVVGVVQQYLTRINAFNNVTAATPYGVNAVAEVNPQLLSQAQQLDTLKSSAGFNLANYPLFGVPVLVKNSYDAVGMKTTNGVSVLNGVGTAGSTNLRPNSDAFSVARLKSAGAIIMGKAALSTMAYSFNGIDNAAGLVRNPYNPNRQPGGSSSGTGAGIAANFAMLGMGGETGGSIRIPSNANALVGLKTSLGLVDPSGAWPLTPSRDVVGPMAKSVKDVAIAMNALVAPSSTNLFNNTPMYPGAAPGTVRPTDYTSNLTIGSLNGKVLAIPKSMVATTGTAPEGTVNSTVLATFNNAVEVMKGRGATVVYVDIPASTKYYSTLGRPNGSGGPTTTGLGYDYPTTTAGGSTPSNTWSTWAAAYYYNELIKSYNDPVITNISDFAVALENGYRGNAGSALSPLGSRNATTGVESGAFLNIKNLADIVAAGNAKGFGDADNDGILDNPDAHRALKAFSDLRNAEYDGFMANPNLTDDPLTAFDESTIDNIDAFISPTYGTVMPTVNTALRVPGVATGTYAGGTASLLGRLEANILGAPSLSIPMGYFDDGTPMGLQFMGEMLGESTILSLGYDYEQATLWRTAPDLSFVVPEPASCSVIVMSLTLLRRRRVG